jgi:hypothetical protein
VSTITDVTGVTNTKKTALIKNGLTSGDTGATTSAPNAGLTCNFYPDTSLSVRPVIIKLWVYNSGGSAAVFKIGACDEVNDCKQRTSWTTTTKILTGDSVTSKQMLLQTLKIIPDASNNGKLTLTLNGGTASVNLLIYL